jgi:hypothetical protein
VLTVSGVVSDPQGASGSEQQQQQARGSSSEDDGGGSILPPGAGQGKGYDWHTRKRGGKDYEVWFTDHDQLTEVGACSECRLCGCSCLPDPGVACNALYCMVLACVSQSCPVLEVLSATPCDWL